MINKNISYIAILALLIVVIFTLIFESDEEQIVAPSIQKHQEKTPIKKKKDGNQDIEISYSNQKKETDNKSRTNKKKDIDKDLPIQKEREEKPIKDTVYELISTGATIDKYQINIVSNSQIPTRDSSKFPQLPASIHGKINGKAFTLIVPSDLGVEDFSVKVKNQETKEINFIPLQKEHIQAGGSSVLRIDTNNFENIELRSENTQTPPLPPFPNLPGFPSK